MVQGDRRNVNLLSLVSAALLVAGICCFSGCAKNQAEMDFRPLQIHWTAALGQDENSMTNKDLCVIKITSQLMVEKPVQASTTGELTYDVVFGKAPNNAEILEFKGVCEDSTLENQPECNWSATCDSEGKVVVKFNNGD